MIDWPKVVRDLEAKNAQLKKAQDALVASAYRAAAEAVNEVIPHNKYEDQSYEYVAAVKKLTPADAEKALREFGLNCLAKLRETSHIVPMVESPSDEQIVDEVMKKK